MPYIRQKDREKFQEMFSTLPLMNNKGELEYVIFKIMKKYMETQEYRYSNLHDCTYAAQHCADEFRRRFLDKREDQAKFENGDI